MADPVVRTGMILAAGFGNRLRPLTDRLPKPLIPLGGESLLAGIAARLRAAGVRRLGVNAHHLPAAIEKAAAGLVGFETVRVFHEPVIQGTGGGPAGMRSLLEDDGDVLLHNGDVWCDADLGALARAHAAGGAEVTLLMTDWPAVNNVRLGVDGRVRDVVGALEAAPRDGDRLLTYCGVAVLSRRFLDALPAGPSHLTDAFLARLRRDPAALRGVVPEGLAWSDLGTPGRYLDALLALNHPADAPARAAAAAALPLLRGTDWSEAKPEPLTEQGSDRGYWRLRRADGATVVLAKSRPDDPEYARGLAVADWLHAAGLGGARVLARDDADGAALVEDLGDDTLYGLAHAAPARRAVLYDAVVDALVRLQAATDCACPDAVDREFGRDDLLWETGYFRRRFLRDLCGVAGDDLDAEFGRIAELTAAQPRLLMHRDFQSRNLLIRDGVVRLVDVQGMRRGPWAYDLVSLLRDPYVTLEPGLREALTLRYRSTARAAGLPLPEDPADFAAGLCLAGLQRMMQALGAYGFLSRVKGKREYLRFVPAALSHLESLLRAARDLGVQPGPLPRLEAAVAEVRSRETERSWATDHQPEETA